MRVEVRQGSRDFTVTGVMSMMRRFLTTFSLVTLLLACAAPAFVAGLVAPALAATDFVVLGDEGIRIEKESTIVGGDVGANRASAGPFLSHGVEVSLDKQVRLLDPASRLLGHRVHLDQDVQVFDVHTNALGGPGPVGGQVITPLTLPLVTLPVIPPVTPGSPDLTVPQQGSLSLAAGSYGTLTVGKEATVTLTGGLYHFAAWAIGNQVRLHMTAPTEIRIAGRLTIDKEAVLGPGPGTSLTAADLLLIVKGVNGATGALDATPKAADVGKQSTLRAKLYVPNGTLRLDKESQVTGALLGKWVDIGKQGQLTFEGGFGLGQSPSAPTLTSFTPTSGTVGTVVTITGTNFDPVAANNQVTVNGNPAIITAVNGTGTSLTTTVPQGATTGPITVTTAQGTGTSAQNFTVTLSADFQISGAPAVATAVQGQSALALVQLTGPASFANLVTLAATVPPGSGVTVTFSAPVVSLTQPVTVTLTSSGTTATGIVPVTLTGTTAIDGQTLTRTATVNFTVVAAGGTTLGGRVLREQDGAPLAGVTLRLGTLTALTDETGRFFLVNAPAGTQILLIDGSTVAAPPGTAYNTLPAQVTIVANQHNELPFVSYLPTVDTTDVSLLDPAQTSVIATPKAPGLRLTIPAGVELRSDVDGSLITQVTVQPISPDRVPVPPPSDPTMHIDPTTIYLFYFHKPGGAIPSQPISDFAIPNDGGVPPGTEMLVYYFDSSNTITPGSNQWKVAGLATVSSDSTQVIPNQGTAIPKLCCGLIYVCPVFGDPFAASNQGNSNGGDPVDLATGQLLITKTDLVLPGRMPIVIERTYQSGRKGLAGPFGRGTSMLLEKQLLSFGGAILYQRGDGRFDLLSPQSDGTFRNLVRPELRGLVLTLGSTVHTVRRKDGSLERYENGRLIELRDRNGNSLAITRNVSGQIASITNGSGVLTFQYDAGGRVTRITDPLGRAVQYTYTPASFLETVTDPAGGGTSYTYDSVGNLLTITDPRGILYLTNQYDTSGRVIRQTLADGGVYQFQYVTFGLTITEAKVTDPREQTTTTRFNAQRYASETTDGLGQQIRRTFNLNNQVTESRDALGRVTKYTYDAAGNVTSITDPDGKVTSFEYEPVFNRVTKITDALNNITTFTYDAQGNLLTTTDPLNHTTTIAYNGFGQPLTVTDALNNVTTFAYDATGNLITTNDPLGNQTQRAYDAVSRLVQLTEPRGFTTQFTYDGLNRVTQITDALNGLPGFTYDPNGNLLTVQDAKGQATAYTYDGMDRLFTRKDALNRTESYQYDPAGNLTQFTDRKTQPATFQYDALNRRVRAGYADGSFTTFVYDAVGRLTRATDSVSGAIDFFYDNLDRLILEVTPQGAVSYEYDAIGRRTTMTVAGQAPVTYQYDAASRLTQVAQGSLIVGLGYDAAGRRTSLTYPNGTNTTYTYDNASRLLTITHNGPSGVIEALTYSYDPAGNRTSLTRTNGTASLLPNAVTSASYDVANQQTQFGGATLTYDQNGSLTSDGTNTYTWDTRNQLIGISGGVTASFSYDSLGRRISKSINGQTSQFLYDGNDIVQEIQSGAVGASYLRSLNIDEPFVRRAGSNEFYHADALGSTLALSNAVGTTAVSYNYEAFGKTTITGTSSNPFQYTGRENDGANIYHYRVRYYSPFFHRFISEDVIDIRGGEPDLYLYVGNDPILRTDPYGLIGFPGAGLLGCSLGALGGSLGAKKPVLGGIVGGLVGCSFSPLIVGIPAGPLGAALGAYTGAISGAVAAAAGSGGDLNSTVIGALSGSIGGALGGALGGGIGAAIGSSVATGLNIGAGFFSGSP